MAYDPNDPKSVDMSFPCRTLPESRDLLLDRGVPTSIYNLSTVPFKDRLDSIPEKYLHMEAQDLASLIKPSQGAEMLKHSFWKEYKKRIRTGGIMNYSDVCAGICGTKGFWKLMDRDGFLPWLVAPEPEVETRLNYMCERGVDRLMEIVTMDIVDHKTGEVNTNRAALLVRTIELLLRRVHGSDIQRIENKNLNVNIDSKAESKEMVDIHAAINDLKNKLNK